MVEKLPASMPGSFPSQRKSRAPDWSDDRPLLLSFSAFYSYEQSSTAK